MQKQYLLFLKVYYLLGIILNKRWGGRDDLKALQTSVLDEEER